MSEKEAEDDLPDDVAEQVLIADEIRALPARMARSFEAARRQRRDGVLGSSSSLGERLVGEAQKERAREKEEAKRLDRAELRANIALVVTGLGVLAAVIDRVL